MIGQDPLGGMSRFTFGFFAIKSGIPLLPMLIGLFALPEILQAVEEKVSFIVKKEFNLKEGERLTFQEFRGCFKTILRSTGIGTALGIIRMAHETGKNVFALVDETRPRLQGGRLTAWELLQYGVPFQVIADGASGHFMRTRGVQLCVVGADRIAANGDAANKIGTYALAVAAARHDVPFYIVAPSSTFDLATPSGASTGPPRPITIP